MHTNDWLKFISFDLYHRTLSSVLFNNNLNPVISNSGQVEPRSRLVDDEGDFDMDGSGPRSEPASR